MQSNPEPSTGKSQLHPPTFAKVLDGRKQPIRGLWVTPTGRFYAQLTFEDPGTGRKQVRRVPLKDADGSPVQSRAEAVAQLERLKTRRLENDLPALRQTPKFSKYSADYITAISAGAGQKKRSTIAKEEDLLEFWRECIGELRLDQIRRPHINTAVEKLLSKNRKPRTVNLYVIALRNVLKRGSEEGWITRLPTDGMKPLRGTTTKRVLFGPTDLEKICTTALQMEEEDGRKIPVTKNGLQFSDYIRLMSYSGLRRNEALGLQWDDVDFANEQLFVRRQHTATGIEDLKNREQRVVDFNPKLKAHLEEMSQRRAPDSKWIFPSPQRGEKDIPAKTFRESLDLVRKKAALSMFNFHDCRHHFISMCVMSGIDFMTIAAWVGHKDGGVLIGKVYGHLANEHRKRMALKVSFEHS